jgi:hypothetical protein
VKYRLLSIGGVLTLVGLLFLSIQLAFALVDGDELAAAQDIIPDIPPVPMTVPEKSSSVPQSQFQPGDATSNQAGPVALSAAATFTIGQNFTGSTFSASGFIPPDTMGAVGPDHIVELINGRYAVYDKNGVSQQSSSLNDFWTNAGVTYAGSFTFDPRVV